jgi:hypothetical protein
MKKLNKRISAILLIIIMTFVGFSYSFLIIKELNQRKAENVDEGLWDIKISHLFGKEIEIDHNCALEDVKLSEDTSHVNALKETRVDCYFYLLSIAKTCDDIIDDIHRSYSFLDKLIGWTMDGFSLEGTLYDDDKALHNININDELSVDPILTHLPGKHNAVYLLNHSLDDFLEISMMVDLNRVPQGIELSNYITGDVMSMSDFVHDAIVVKKNKNLKEFRKHVFIATFIFILISLCFAYFVYYKNINIKILWIFLILNIWIILNHYII